MSTTLPTNSLATTIAAYLDSVLLSRSANTARTYRNALSAFTNMLETINIDPSKTASSEITEDWVSDFATSLKSYAPATERLYLTAISGWYAYLAAENLAAINLPRVQLLIRQRSRRPGQRLPQFPQQDIEKVIGYAQDILLRRNQKPKQRLIDLRDRSFLLTLSDTGLRVHEACNLRRGDIDWNEGRALLIGKGNRESVVRFSHRSLAAIKDYLAVRARLDGGSGRPLRSLPIFARHDQGAGKRVLPISTTTGRAIVHQRVHEALDDDTYENITPHSFRHYFVTTVLRGSGGNLKLAQELARHRNIAITQRYAHLSDDELDQGYYEIFDSKER